MSDDMGAFDVQRIQHGNCVADSDILTIGVIAVGHV